MGVNAGAAPVPAVANPAAISARRQAARRAADEAAASGHPVLAAVWAALREVEDPELPVSVVDLGLIVSTEYDAAMRAVHVRLTLTAMGCPAVEMIEEDIQQRLLRLDGVERATTEVVWDPAWTSERLSDSARATMRGLGLAG